MSELDGDKLAHKKAQVELVIARIQNVYGAWRRDTSVEKMRQDWDQLFWNDSQPSDYRDDKIDGVAVRWISAPNTRRDRVLLYFHGGGYKMGSVISHHDLIVRISAASDCQVLGVNYRMCPEDPFPAPVEDAVTVYRALLNKGFAADQLAVAGDSAGGGLAAASLLALRNESLPTPAAAVLISAWLDMTLSGESYESRAKSDPIHQRFMLDALASQYLGKDGDRRNPLASPLFGSLSGLPPILLQIGDRETGLDDTLSFAKVAAEQGVKVECSVWDDMIHVFQQFAEELDDAREAIAQIGEFLQRQWALKD
jgi:monoterpene epsilon-lactone hydrolase